MGTKPGHAGSNLRPNIAGAAGGGSQRHVGLHLAGDVHRTRLPPAWHPPPPAHVLSPIEEGPTVGMAETLLLQQPPLPTPPSKTLLYYFFF